MYLLARFFMDRKKKTQKTPISLGFGVPGAARTRGLSLRRRTLYPTELRRLVIQLLPESECTYIHLGGERSILLSYGEICARGYFRTQS